MTTAKRITPEFVAAVCKRVAANQRVRRSLPTWGRVSVERQLPYLVVYRRPQERADAGTDRIAVTSPAHITAVADRTQRAGVHELVTHVTTTLAAAFGAVLVVEMWTRPDVAAEPEEIPAPSFRIATARARAGAGYVRRLEAELGRIVIQKRRAEVTVDAGAAAAPPGMRPLLTPGEAARLGCHVIGLELSPIHQAPGGEVEYPIVTREMRRRVNRALARAFYEFARSETSHRPRSYHALGRRAMVKAVWDADRQLAEVGGSFDLLLSVTPVNADRAWAQFQRHRYERPPTFAYRPLTFEPDALKRRLHQIRLTPIEDPTIAHLFLEQRRHLDRQLTLLGSRERPAFLYDGLALYGAIDPDLHALAERILERLDGRQRRSRSLVRADAFAARARSEIAHYRAAHPELRTTVDVRDDLSSLMVSRGDLLVGSSIGVPPDRVEALIQHEIGTHVVTHVNGSQQRIRLLASGLAGYEALQEGLGVFAEFAVGGLSTARVRLLAARVVAAEAVVAGASFVETFRLLCDEHELQKKSAFQVATRVHRGGGFVKDAIYLKGIVGVLDYLADGGDLATVLLGKLALEHVGTIEELRRRQVVRSPLLLPRYLEHEGAQERIAAVRAGLTLDGITKELNATRGGAS